MEDLKNKIHVSVFMPVYNGASYIGQQIDSILSQTCPVEKIFIQDDGSTDGTYAIVHNRSESDTIVLTKNNVNLGVVGNIKNGIKAFLDHHYLALADQDDVWLPEKLALYREKMKSLESDNDGNLPCLVYSDQAIINERGQLVADSFWTQNGHDKFSHCLETLLFTNFVTGCATLMNPSMISHLSKMPEIKGVYHDAWIALIAFSIGKAGKIDQPLVLHRQHENSLTLSQSKRRSLYSRLRTHVDSFKAPEAFLENQFDLIERFFKTYRSLLPSDKKELFEKTLSYRKKSFLRKKIWIYHYYKKHKT